MIGTNSYSLIKMGLCIRLLSNIDGVTKPEYVLEHISMLHRELANNDFDVSLIGINLLSEYISKLIEIKNEENLTNFSIREFCKVMHSFELIIAAEAQTKYMFMFQKRKYNLDYLLREPNRLFKDDVFFHTSEIARSDITSACRCIVFGEATATAFHILRATEDVLKQYYYSYKIKNRNLRPMWGNMVQELRLIKRNKPNKNILDTLDIIRVSYRNPTQHPEAIYNIDTAQNLFGVCIDIISQMVQNQKNYA